MEIVKTFFKKDNVMVGLVAGLGSMLLLALLLTLVLVMIGQSPMEHLRWYAGVFVAPLLLLRYFIKQGQGVVSKTLMVTLFVTFIPFMFILFKTNAINLQ